MKEIFNRRSIRKFKDQAVEPEKIELMLKAAMQAPSAANQQPWEFIVVQEKENLLKLSQASPYARPVEGSGVTFLVMANADILRVPTAWEEDLGAATQNLLLEAVHLGLGGVWLGVATADSVVESVRKLYNLPENIKPYALIAVGYPDGQQNEFVDRYNKDRVHYEKWS
ncbi:nitroreductase family protein [Anaerocolumna sp. AGMB13020]|uniref:nitroreductase family protein n=1 Tax=Anaerocolumna sp. AGMB13020 TaxID=3081750 RepID=UPI0029544C69|nr:nitroreductase family protein [Anaerocolumna sp. AGMB13020]WOO38126.1 nitroreductase family protein [Anaerocolumna sp. AGMB13020]